MEVTRFGREGWLSRRNEVRADLSVLRTEDVPLEEVSGVCLRRVAGGDMGLVAFGDRTSVAAHVELPDDDRGRYSWRTVDLADVDGSLIPRDDPQVEAVCADGAGWKLPRLDGKPEGLALSRNGRAIVALDTKEARDNLVLLEPPIANRRPA